MTLSKNAETGISLAIPEISSEVSLLIPTYTDLYRVIPKRDPGISHYKNLILAYPKTSFLSQLIPGYPGIGHMSDDSGNPGISWYKSGYGRVSRCTFELLWPGAAAESTLQTKGEAAATLKVSIGPGLKCRSQLGFPSPHSHGG